VALLAAETRRKQSPMPIAPLYVFDAYGTLFDVHSAVARHAGDIGPDAARLSDMWRTKQLEYTWVRSLSGRYRDFEALTQDALDYAAARCGGLSPALRANLLAAYAELDAYPDATRTLDALRAAGAKTAILSNGTPAMLARAVASAGLADRLDAVLSVDPLRMYKTAPAAYALVEAHFGVAPAEVCFLSSNRWDIAGASAFGLRCVWVNRLGLPDEYDELAPAAAVGSLEGLLALEL
jgi:2-haloacid dehalogenase